MTSHQKYLSLCLLMIVALLYGLSPALAQTLDDFAALAGQKVTCTTSMVDGDVGVANPAGLIVTCTPTNGTTHQGGAAVAAYEDFLDAYATLATQPPCDPSKLEVPLTGPLTQGVYCYAAAVTATGTTVTLNGPCDGTWIFRVGTSGTGALTTTNFTVQHSNPACDACDANVVWWTAQAATLTDSTLIGSILAGADITVTRGALEGQALAGGRGTTTTPTGEVTLTNAIVNACEGTVLPPPPPPGNGNGNGNGKDKEKCNQGLGNGPEGCDPGNSNNKGKPSNDETPGAEPGNPGRK